MELYYLITILSFVTFCSSNREIITFITPENCSEREYFVPSLMTCRQCNDHQKSSLDRLSCICEKNSKIVDKVSEFSCEPCPSNFTATLDHLHCLKKPNVTCGLKEIEFPYYFSDSISYYSEENVYYLTLSQKEALVEFMENQPDFMKVETEPNGLPLAKKSCIRCSPGTFPSLDHTQCLPCQVVNCTCPQTSHEWLLDGTLCVFSQNLTLFPDERETHIVEYDVVGVDVESKYLKKHLRALLYKCVKMKNRMSCESLGNLCTVQMYKDERKVNPCRVFKDYRRIPTSSDADRLPLPWIYYGEGDASVALNRKKITSKYTIRPGSRKSKLQLVAARYNLNGSLIKLSELSPVELQLCPGLWNGIESAFRFGARYFQTCNIPAKQLIGQLVSTEPIFYDFYLQYDDGKKNMLYAIPLLVRNIKVGSTYPNKGRDISQWLLTRRMFLMDLFSGISTKTQGLPTVIQYLKTVKLVVQAQREIENEGNIYPPFMVLEYGQITDENVSSNELCPVTFTVEFYMENDILHYVDMSLGILSGCVFIWSCIHTWSESKRCGRMAIDLWTVGQFAITCCSHFANMIFVVCLLLAVHTLFFYKAQSVVYILLPSQDLEAVINRYVVIAFLLKIVEIVRLIWKQTTIDIFLVDWEKPRISPNQKQNGIMATQKQTVSIWRSYFVANEWAEIQTKRKISFPLQILFTILLLKIYGLENWAAAEPEVHLTEVPYRPISQLLGFGMLVIVFSIVYIVQWITTVAIYERYIKNCIQQFVDICSLANISVFILSAEFFGYYIHGRSAHGFSDTDMESLIGQLRREEDNMVRHRGLMPGTENQTFEMTIPSSLKTYYRRVMAPLNNIQSKQISGSSFRIKKVDKTDMVKIGQAYNNMNKFLAAFLDHALKDLDYEIREKTFVEKLLGIEYSDPLDKGVFFIDDGHSFDQVIFYGNECTLVIFDLMMLSFFYVLTENIVLSGIITGFLIKVMSVIRTTFGKRNLAKKTLIDERFLI